MKRIYVVLFHIIYWLPSSVSVLLSLQVMLEYDKANVSNRSGAMLHYYYMLNPIYFVIGFVVFYLFYFYFFPRYLARQKIKQFIIYGAITCAIPVLLGIVFFKPFLIAAYPKNNGIALSYYFGIVTKVISSAVAACMFRGALSWYQDIRYKKELENKNLQTELALLKAQINPHFLFNTLNNIDILIEKDAKTASVYLKKLSDILRFMLYDTPNETIPLSTELDYIKTYIELQKIRTANANFVKFEVNGNANGLFIAPMIFIPFIENAFKHSTNKKVDHAIEITIVIQNDEIDFSCVNVFDDVNALPQPNSGLGLELINSRLNLLYQGNHQLKVDKTDNRFAVHLTIKADDH